jgi:ribosome-associated toxin RatA of RatAB toxin-antitoxin module
MKRTRTIARYVPWSGIVLAALFGSAVPLRASDSPSVSIQDLGHGAYHVEGWFTVPVPLKTAWEVLTDYEHIGSFVSTLRNSRMKESHPHGLLLEQEAVGSFLLFSRTVRVLLRVVESPFQRIDFEDIGHQDFVSYKGSWEFRPHAGGLDVLYTLDCHRRFKVPNFMARDVMKKVARQQMADVRGEMLRRAQGPAAPE